MSDRSQFDRDKRLASLARAVPPFIGRRAQIAFFDRCLKEFIVGRPQVILIRGNAGVGKTRLLKEMRLVAPSYGVSVCYGRCYEDLALPYLPFIESLFAQLQQMSEEVQRTLGTNLEVINQFLHRDSIATPATNPSLSTQADQDTLRLFLALSHATIKLAQSRPLLLAVDDLQWADRSSLDLFSHLVFTVADIALRESVPFLIIGTHRPVDPEHPLARATARFQREEICRILELPGLDEGEVDELLQGLGVTRPSHQLVATVNEATRGNPLFIQEVVDQLMKQGALEERGGYVVTVAAPADLHLPDQITVAISERIEGLSKDCQRALTLASFLGDQFSFQVLSAVSSLSEDELLDLLEEGMRHRLLLSEGQTFRFAHPLIHHVLHTEPSATRRQRIHHQIAQTLERLYAGSREEHILEIAHHWVNAGTAGEAAKVVEYARLAGDYAFRIFAWGDAARYYEAALSAGETTGRFSPQSQGELHYLAGYAHYRDMDVGPCLDHYEKAVEAYRLSGDVRGLALALKEKVGAHFTLASVPYGTLIDVQPLEEVLTALGESEPGLRGRLLAKIAQAYWHARQADKAEEIARLTFGIGQRINDDPLCAEASLALALAQTQRLQVKDALESWQDSLNSARRADDLWRQGWALQRIPLTLTALGRLEEAEAMALEACALIHQTHDWGGYALALATLVTVAVTRGDFAVAEKHAREVMLMVRRSRYPWGGANALPPLACARFLCGAWIEADDAIDILVEPGRVFEEAGSAYQA
ncbi:MAG TPA: AAA family ATPase, partial [Candidatus Binatia bacterium]|nr:AAA family ATPase [Candidatus Binatia bacterium]